MSRGRRPTQCPPTTLTSRQPRCRPPADRPSRPREAKPGPADAPGPHLSAAIGPAGLHSASQELAGGSYTAIQVFAECPGTTSARTSLRGTTRALARSSTPKSSASPSTCWPSYRRRAALEFAVGTGRIALPLAARGVPCLRHRTLHRHDRADSVARTTGSVSTSRSAIWQRRESAARSGSCTWCSTPSET